IERIALETNLSLWDTLGHIVEQRLMQPRACAALKTFRELIDDARAMLFGTFEDRLTETAQPAPEADLEAVSDAAEPELFDDEDLAGNMAFDFGELEASAEEFSPESLTE